MKKIVDNHKCLVAVMDRKTHIMRQCRNVPEKGGKVCVVHSTAIDCGEKVIYWPEGR